MGYKKITQLPTILTGLSSTDKLVIVVSGVTYKTTPGALLTLGTSGTSGVSGTSGTSGVNGSSGTSGTSTLIKVNEYSFTTTGNTTLDVGYRYIQSDYAGTDFFYGTQYEINIFAVNVTNGDLWSEKRLYAISGRDGITPSQVESEDIIGTPWRGTSMTLPLDLIPIVNDIGNGIYNITFQALGLAGEIINWKVQFKRIYL
jgi:hypothetical protein